MICPTPTIAFIQTVKLSWQYLGLPPNDSDHSIQEITAAFEVLGQHVVHIDVIKAQVSHLTLTTTFTKDRLNRCKMTKNMIASRTLRRIQSRNAPRDTNSHMTVVPTNRAKPQVQDTCQLALAARKALGCRDAGRIDTRFDQVGEVVPPSISEINPIFWNLTDWSDLALIATSNRLPLDRFLEDIINYG